MKTPENSIWIWDCDKYTLSRGLILGHCYVLLDDFTGYLIGKVGISRCTCPKWAKNFLLEII